MNPTTDVNDTALREAHDPAVHDRGTTVIHIAVRTPAGARHEFGFSEHDRIDKVVREALRYFVSVGQLQDGSYGLKLERDGKLLALSDSGQLEDYEIRECDQLFLTIREPQVDG